jgi:hypothetical protein
MATAAACQKAGHFKRENDIPFSPLLMMVKHNYEISFIKLYLKGTKSGKS